MKTQNKDFLLFQKEFKKWQVKFGVTGYKIYFEYEPLDSFASITVNQNAMVATVKLDSSGECGDHRDIREHAKHEAIHLLTWRLENRATSRYVLDSEIYETVEELVCRLEGLIQ